MKEERQTKVKNYCKDCLSYKRPKCTLLDIFTARKKSCSKFVAKKQK